MERARDQHNDAMADNSLESCLRVRTKVLVVVNCDRPALRTTEELKCITQVLQAHAFFQRWGDRDAVHKLCGLLGFLHVHAGESVTRRGESVSCMCLVLSGTVDVELPRSQPQLHVSQPHVGQPSDPRVAGRPEYRSLGPGAALGWEALLRDDHRARASMTAGPAGVRCATLSSGAWTDIGARAAAGSAQWAVVRSLVLSTAVAQLAAKAGGGGTESGCAGGPREAAGEGAETRGGTERGADAVAEAEAAVLTGAADAWDRLQEELLAVALARMQGLLSAMPHRMLCEAARSCVLRLLRPHAPLFAAGSQPRFQAVVLFGQLQERTFRAKGSPITALLGARASGSQVKDMSATPGASTGPGQAPEAGAGAALRAAKTSCSSSASYGGGGGGTAGAGTGAAGGEEEEGQDSDEEAEDGAGEEALGDGNEEEDTGGAPASADELMAAAQPHDGSTLEAAFQMAEEGERRLASRYGPVVATHGSGAAAGELSLAAITGAKGGRKPRRVSVTAGPHPTLVLVVPLAALRRGYATAQALLVSRRTTALSGCEGLAPLLLRALAPGEVSTLAAAAQPVVLAAGSVLARQGAPVEALYLVQEGEIRLVDDPESEALQQQQQQQAAAQQSQQQQSAQHQQQQNPFSGDATGASKSGALSSTAIAAALADPVLGSELGPLRAPAAGGGGGSGEGGCGPGGGGGGGGGTVEAAAMAAVAAMAAAGGAGQAMQAPRSLAGLAPLLTVGAGGLLGLAVMGLGARPDSGGGDGGGVAGERADGAANATAAPRQRRSSTVGSGTPEAPRLESPQPPSTLPPKTPAGPGNASPAPNLPQNGRAHRASDAALPHNAPTASSSSTAASQASSSVGPALPRPSTDGRPSSTPKDAQQGEAAKGPSGLGHPKDPAVQDAGAPAPSRPPARAALTSTTTTTTTTTSKEVTSSSSSGVCMFGVHPATAVAVGPTRLLALPREALVRCPAAVAAALAAAAGEQLQVLERRRKEVVDMRAQLPSVITVEGMAAPPPAPRDPFAVTHRRRAERAAAVEALHAPTSAVRPPEVLPPEEAMARPSAMLGKMGFKVPKLRSSFAAPSIPTSCSSTPTPSPGLSPAAPSPSHPTGSLKLIHTTTTPSLDRVDSPGASSAPGSPAHRTTSTHLLCTLSSLDPGAPPAPGRMASPCHSPLLSLSRMSSSPFHTSSLTAIRSHSSCSGAPGPGSLPHLLALPHPRSSLCGLTPNHASHVAAMHGHVSGMPYTDTEAPPSPQLRSPAHSRSATLPKLSNLGVGGSSSEQLPVLSRVAHAAPVPRHSSTEMLVGAGGAGGDSPSARPPTALALSVLMADPSLGGSGGGLSAQRSRWDVQEHKQGQHGQQQQLQQQEQHACHLPRIGGPGSPSAASPRREGSRSGSVSCPLPPALAAARTSAGPPTLPHHSEPDDGSGGRIHGYASRKKSLLIRTGSGIVMN